MLPRFPGTLVRGCMQQWAGLQLSFSAQWGQGSHRKGPKADKTHLGTKEAVLSIKLFAETSQ